MVQWEIPHDEKHRFLQFGLRDAVFNAWCRYFDSKGIEYEVGGARDSWTIYKHMLYTNMSAADKGDRKISPCCLQEEDEMF